MNCDWFIGKLTVVIWLVAIHLQMKGIFCLPMYFLRHFLHSTKINLCCSVYLCVSLFLFVCFPAVLLCNGFLSSFSFKCIMDNFKFLFHTYISQFWGEKKMLSCRTRDNGGENPRFNLSLLFPFFHYPYHFVYFFCYQRAGIGQAGESHGRNREAAKRGTKPASRPPTTKTQGQF